uniref:Uncharacterized protein n=1 Tax=Zea mays TaxID=4577 RepID=C0PLN7_MAIZE|nr:unknown [Zea mays]
MATIPATFHRVRASPSTRNGTTPSRSAASMAALPASPSGTPCARATYASGRTPLAGTRNGSARSTASVAPANARRHSRREK